VEFQVHGALVEALDVGVLLRGPSGVGKSECALELVQRGHRLVADDVVRLSCRRTASGEELIGRAPELIRHYMEIRGIGLLHVPDLYGPDSVRAERRVDLVCDLEPWRDEGDYERIGLDRPRIDLVGVAIPMLRLPVRPARNMATLVEVAVRDHRQRAAGVNAAKRLDMLLRSRTRGEAGSRREMGE
jgi:HPr kinase/phosphorylase